MATGPDFGSPTPIAFAYFDRDSSSWRTCQGSLLEGSGESCTTWPRQGTWDAGFAYELPTSALPTAASESFCSPDSPRLPTPRVTSQRTGRAKMTEQQQWSGVSLGQALEIARGELPREFQSWEEVPGGLGRLAREQLLPTPTSQAARHGSTPDRAAHGWGFNLWDVPHLLPTPGANDSTGGEGPTREARQEQGETGGPALRDIAHLLPTPTASERERTPAEAERRVSAEGRPNQGGPDLSTVAALLPTPQARDGKGAANDWTTRTRDGRPRTPGDMTLPDAARLSGASTGPPSDVGSESSAEPLPGQLTIGDA